MKVHKAIVFGVSHLVVLLLCLSISFGLGMDRFDNPGLEKGLLEKTTGALTSVLMTPAKFIWVPAISKNMPNSIEWLLMLLNSYAWGWLISKLYEKFN